MKLKKKIKRVRSQTDLIQTYFVEVGLFTSKNKFICSATVAVTGRSAQALVLPRKEKKKAVEEAAIVIENKLFELMEKERREEIEAGKDK